MTMQQNQSNALASDLNPPPEQAAAAMKAEKPLTPFSHDPSIEEEKKEPLRQIYYQEGNDENED